MRFPAKTVTFVGLLSCLLLPSPRVDAEESLEGTRPINSGYFPAIDTIIQNAILNNHVPGAVFVAVNNDSVVYRKGYGFADLEGRTPIDPFHTVFPIASVTKLFTMTAVMQLVDQGKLNLDQDVNLYLRDFQLEPTFPKPVTLRNLLTHTAGFDDQYIGMFFSDEGAARDIRTHLINRIPPRVFPPGETISYSNYGTALAGYIVETVSGEAYPDFVKQNILGPLRMDQSDFFPSLDQRRFSVKSYQGEEEVKPYFDLLPAGGLHVTGEDMSHFMISLLSRGRYDNSQIFGSVISDQIFTTQFSSHPRLPGFGLGFSQHFENGTIGYEHTGDNPGVSAILFLVPDTKAGFFLAYNSDEVDIRKAVTSAFLDATTPGERPVERLQPLTPIPEDTIGTYQSNRFDRHTLMKLLGMFYQVQVTRKPTENKLELNYALDARPSKTLSPIDGNLYQDDSKKDLVAFLPNSAGEIVRMAMEDHSSNGDLEKISWFETLPIQLGILGVSTFLFLLAILFPFGSLVFRRKTRLSSSAFHLTRRLQWVAATVGLFNTVFVFGFLAILASNISSGGGEFFYRVPMPLIILLLLPILTTILSIFFALRVYTSWRDPQWTLAGKLHAIMFVIAETMFVLFLVKWNLLGFHL